MSGEGPKRLQFNQTERITSRLRDLVRNYPKGLGLVKEFLQNADDAGASRLLVIFDRRQHSGRFNDNPAMEVALGPSLIFVNDRVFSDDDIRRIQEIGEGSKVSEAGRTGRFGQGFNTCYSVTDHPTLLSGNFVAWFDPHHRVFKEGSNAYAWELPEVEKYWPDWIKTFEPAGWKKGMSIFPGTAFRLPLRSELDAEQSEILKEPFSEQDFKSIIDELNNVGTALLVFLRSITDLGIIVIDQKGKNIPQYRISTTNSAAIEIHRSKLRSIVEGNPKELLDCWLANQDDLPVVQYDHIFRVFDIDGCKRDETWSVVTGLFRGPENLLLHQALDVCKHHEKAIPWAGAAICRDSSGKKTQMGGISCFLPLPEQTRWPLWLHGWFDLSSNRKGITRDADVGETTRSRYLWNKALMEYAVGRAWALLIESTTGLHEENSNPYALWLRIPDKLDDVDSSLVNGFYHNVSQLRVIRGRNSSNHDWYKVDDIRNLPAEWSEKLTEPLIAEGRVVADPHLPEFVKNGFKRVNISHHTLSPKILRDSLKSKDSDSDVSCDLLDAPRQMLRKHDWVCAITEFCADGNFNNLQFLPLALLSDGKLHTYNLCGKLLLARDSERKLLDALPERLLERHYQDAVGIHTPAQIINLVELTLAELIKQIPLILSAKAYDNAFLVSLFDYLTAYDESNIKDLTDELCSLDLIPDQLGNWCQMGQIETPLIPGSTSRRTRDALMRLGIPILTTDKQLEAAIFRFSSKHAGFVWELTPNDIAYNLKSHAEEACLNEDCLDDRDVLEPLLDLLSSTLWLQKPDDRLPFLQRIQLLPTTCGRRVAAQDENVYIPDFRPPKGFEGKYFLLNTGDGGRWVTLYQALDIPRLDGVRFVKRVLLRSFKNATLDQCRDYLTWIRDEFRFVERKLTEEEREELRKEIRGNPILPIEGGGMHPPMFVYRPDATEPEELLGKVARMPDKHFFTMDKDLWLEFFEEFKLPRRPLARDLYAKIKCLSEEASLSGAGSVKASIRKIIDHLRERWSNLSTFKVDGEDTLASALSKLAWLPASADETNYAACTKWPDRLWRPNELIPPGRLAHLCASKFPILEGAEFSKEISDAIGLVTSLNPEDVFEHFSKVMLCTINDEKAIDVVQKAADGFYRYLGQVDLESSEIHALVEKLKNQLCIFVSGGWRHPTQCFFDSLPFATEWAVSLEGSNLSISESSVLKGLTSLGVRQHPCNDDWLLLLTDYADKFNGNPLPQGLLNQARYAIRMLRFATNQWLLEQEVYIPLQDGRLEIASHALLPDDPRLKNYKGENSLPLIEDNEDAIDVGRRSGAKSLRGALIERLKVLPTPTKNPKYVQLAIRVQHALRSRHFFVCLQRIAYEAAIRDRDNEVDPLEAAFAEKLKLPQSIRVVITPSIHVKTVVDLGGEEIVVFDLETPSFLDRETFSFYIKEGRDRRILDATVRTVCELCLLSDQLTLSRVLEVGPEHMSEVLDDEEVATLPEGQTLVLECYPVAKTLVDSIDSDIACEADDGSLLAVRDKDKEEVGVDLEEALHGPISLNEDSKNLSENEKIESAKNSVSTKSLVPPITPGHGSSNPWHPDDYVQTTHTRSENKVSEANSGNRRFGSQVGTSHYDGQQQHQWVDSISPHAGPSTIPGHGSSKPSDSLGKNITDSIRQVRMRTYVHEKIQDNYDTGDSDSRATKLGNAGEQIVMEYEKKRKRVARQMPLNHEGYDIESKGRDGIRYIEVKSIDGPWSHRGVGVTRAQYAKAMKLGKEWWLYVVEYVMDPSRKRVHPINNPFQLATEFRFDSGWMGAQVDESGVSPVSNKPKIGASYERETGEIVNIKGTTQSGEFWRVSFLDPDGNIKQAIWNASWRMI